MVLNEKHEADRDQTRYAEVVRQEQSGRSTRVNETKNRTHAAHAYICIKERAPAHLRVLWNRELLKHLHDTRLYAKL